jgi:hypothetical protein
MTAILHTTYLLLWSVVLLQAFLIVVLVYQLNDVRRQIEAAGLALGADPLPIESVAPTFSATNLLSGDRIHSSTLRGRPLALLFLSTDCSVCRNLARDLARIPAEKLNNLIVYCNGAGRGCQSLLSEISNSVLVLRKDTESVSALFDLHSFPAAVLLDEDWTIEGFRYPRRVSHVVDCLSRDFAKQRTAIASTEELVGAEQRS